MDTRLDALQRRIGHRFADAALLTRALTHRSFGADHNERLEFLGDAVLSLVISRLLYERFAGSDEGDLTRVRAHLVREESLHRAALQLALPDVLNLGEGEARGGGAQRASILADALEALIGATFLDGGFEAARTVVTGLFGEVIATTDIASWSKDAKTELQEWLQARRLPVPVYRIRATRGQAHAQTFEVECAVAGTATWWKRASAARAGSPNRRPRGACSTASSAATSLAARCSPERLPPTEAPMTTDTPEDSTADDSTPQRCGLVAIVGRPERRQVDPAERAGRPEGEHHLGQGADHPPPHHRHPHGRRLAVRVRRHAGLPDPPQPPRSTAP